MFPFCWLSIVFRYLASPKKVQLQAPCKITADPTFDSSRSKAYYRYNLTPLVTLKSFLIHLYLFSFPHRLGEWMRFSHLSSGNSVCIYCITEASQPTSIRWLLSAFLCLRLAVFVSQTHLQWWSRWCRAGVYILLVLCCVPGGGVFARAVVLWTEGPEDVASVGAVLSLPHPPGQLVSPRQFGRVWFGTALCQVRGSAYTVYPSEFGHLNSVIAPSAGMSWKVLWKAYNGRMHCQGSFVRTASNTSSSAYRDLIKEVVKMLGQMNALDHIITVAAEHGIKDIKPLLEAKS